MSEEFMKCDEFAVSIINAIVSNPENFSALDMTTEDFSRWAAFAYDFAEAMVMESKKRYK